MSDTSDFIERGDTDKRASSVRINHMVRIMSFYPVQEQEMHSLAIANSMTTFFSSIGSGFGFLAIGKIHELYRSNDSISLQMIIDDAMLMMFLVLSAASVLAAGIYLRHRRKLINHIKNTTLQTEINLTVPAQER